MMIYRKIGFPQSRSALALSILLPVTSNTAATALLLASSSILRHTPTFTTGNRLLKSRRYQSSSNSLSEYEAKRRFHITAERLNYGDFSQTSISTVDKEEENSITKIIHFQRHGQGYHNLLWSVFSDFGVEPNLDETDPAKNPMIRPEVQDPPLTELGRQQCAAQRPNASNFNPELVVVSPLHRAVQTAHITFADHNDGCVPWVAHDGCREELGFLVINKRRPLVETMGEFPGVDFSLVQGGNEDLLWNPTRRESMVEQRDRVYSFLVDFLREREEKEIVVVGHSAWLSNMCNEVLDCGEDDELRAWFTVSEVRSMKVTFSLNELVTS